jgi:O-antigen/teichoic acid export membrane protein
MDNKIPSGVATKRISKETLIYIPVFLVPALVNILTLSLFTKIFPPNQYGEYSLVVNTTIIISSLMGQWIVLSIQRFRPEYRNAGKLSEFNLYLNRLLFQMSLIFLFISIFIYPFISETYKHYYIVSIFSIVLSVYFMVLSSVYQIDLLSKKFRNLNVIQSLGKLPVTFLLLLMISFTPEQFIWGTVLMQVILLYPMLRYIEVKRFLTFATFDKNQYKVYIHTFFVYGFPLIGWYIGTTILNLTDRYMIQFFRGAYEVGVYSANFTIAVQALALICNPFFFAVQPQIMNRTDTSKNDMELLISKYTKIYILLSIPFGIYFSIYRNEVSSLLLGDQFVKGSGIIPILIIGFFFWNLGLYGQLCCQIDKRTKHMFYFVAIAAFVNFALNFILIPKYGYIGAAISTGIGFVIYTLLIYISSMKNTRWMIPWFSMVRILTVSIVFAIPLELIRSAWLTDLNTIISMAIGISYFFVYIVLLIILKELPVLQIINKVLTNK